MTVTDVSEDTRLERKFELWDELPEGYAEAAARISSFQALAEVVGVLAYAEWLDRAPSFERKQMLMAKIQDEVGHGHVTFRVAEDLGVDREAVLQGFADGNVRVLNIFHYGFDTWEELGPAALLQNSSAIVQFTSLHHGTYLPYARALRKIEKEESFHYHHSIDLTHQTMVLGSRKQRQLVQDAFERWVPRMLAYFGPPDTATYRDNQMFQFGLKVKSNDQLRQEWLEKIIPVFKDLGVYVDPALARYDEDEKVWRHIDIDWVETKRILKEGGPRVHEWQEHIRGTIDRNNVYRDVARGVAA